MALGSFAGHSFWQSAGHIDLILPDSQTISPSAVAATTAIGTAAVQLQVSNTGIPSSVAFGTSKAQLQANTVGIAST